MALFYLEKPGCLFQESAIDCNPNSCPPVAAVALTAWQYSLINGWGTFYASSVNKFLFRSGLGHQVGSAVASLEPACMAARGYVLRARLRCRFRPYPLFVANSESRRNGKTETSKARRQAIIFAALVPVILHHLIFFNFTANHWFSALKAAPIFAISAGLLVSTIWEATNKSVALRIS